MTEDVAYAAGLFEGEGSVYVPKQRGTVRLTMCSTDLEPLERLVNVWGGKICGPYAYKGRKPIYHWTQCGWERVESIYREIRTLLSPRRRRQFEAALTNPRRQELHYNRLKTHCRNGHAYDERNTRMSITGERVCRTCRREQASERRRSAASC